MQLKVKVAFVVSALVLVSGCKTRSSAPKAVVSEDSEVSNAQCLDNLLTKLDLNGQIQTDPKLVGHVLKNVMRIDDFKPLKSLPKFSAENIELTPMVKTIRDSVVAKHPIILEFLCELDESKLAGQFTPSDLALVKQSVHYTYILNELTSQMEDDFVFMQQIIDHLRKKRVSIGFEGSLLNKAKEIKRITGEWFSPAKTLTIDFGIDLVMSARTGKKAKPVGVDMKYDSRSLNLNILEAAHADAGRGLVSNALAGVALTLNPPTLRRMTEDTHFATYPDMSQEWVSLYQTWNFAVITENLKNLDLMYPKLLIPEVMNAKPSFYLMNRMSALWLTIHFQLFAQASKQKFVYEDGNVTTLPVDGVNRELPNSGTYAKIWGEINLEHAKKYIKKTKNKDLDKYFDYANSLGSKPFDKFRNRFMEIIGQKEESTEREGW